MLPMRRDDAETLALGALGWIVSDPDRAGALLSASGASVEDLRSHAADAEFLGFVLDFLLMDEEAVLAFAEALPCRPEDVMRARAGLPGGDLPNWT